MKAETLRKSILQYAIQGKLVPQVDAEKPASELLKSIQYEKQQLIKEGKIKKEKHLPPITDDEKPFDIPENWEWVRVSDCAILYTGDSINAQEKNKKYSNLFEGYNYIATKDIGFDTLINYSNGIKIPFETSFKIAKSDSILLCIEGGSAGRKIGLLNEDVCFGNKLCCFENIGINYLYLFYYLQTPIFIENFKDNKSGMIGGVGINTLKTLYFPLPPLDEQQRIVARIQELMLFVDKYEQKAVELEKLEKEFPEKLKKSILQYAMQGKLVEQDLTKETIKELLEKITDEKEELVRQSKIKRFKPAPLIKEDEKPFEIPDSWQWIRLSELLSEAPSNGYSPKGVEFETEYKVLTLSATTTGYFDQSKFKYFISETELNDKLKLYKDNILIQRSNSIEYVGVPCICPRDFDGYIYPDLMIKLSFLRAINIKYIYYLLASPITRNYFRYNASGTSDTMKKINQTIVANSLVPLPPKAEQQRIVERIEDLFKLVDMISSGKKSNVEQIEPSLSVTPSITEFRPNKQTNKSVDVVSFGLVAREKGEFTQADLDVALSEVQDFYDRKKN